MSRNPRPIILRADAPAVVLPFNAPPTAADCFVEARALYGRMLALEARLRAVVPSASPAAWSAAQSDREASLIAHALGCSEARCAWKRWEAVWHAWQRGEAWASVERIFLATRAFAQAVAADEREASLAPRRLDA